MTNKQTAKEKIKSLVIRFEEQFESYKNSDYNETLTRRDFIDPFFKALGWDIDNESGYAEAYREVIHEDKVKVSGSIKAPDYSFRLVGGKRLFFVEAKKPSISVKEDIQPAYQVRRYGWSAKLPISIITDFEEFSIYDCTKKPKPNDKPPVARIKYLSFRDYIKEFDFLWDTFSKEQVLKGSFDKFLQSDTHKKGTATVDKDFLESLDRWRTYLAVSISWNNKTLDEDEINYVVQQTIDRIIFLRIAEDRGVEPYGALHHTTKLGNLYQNLFELFQKADQKYNSGLFDFKKDKISQDVIIDNKVIKTIINELYYPECPYEFSVLSVEILGSAYEQFLGKVIRITPAHHAKIEEKPEVRKAGGVYYTPQYIVDYIVKNTVGKLIEGKTPKDISKIKILDPACGSGSFLIGAFQYLLDYHKDYYSENGKPSKGKKDSPLTPDGHLSTAEKKRILLNNIFGVDLDVNAVEVTKLSLLIKCLEGETEASIQQQLSMWNERVLPTLDNNIKSGNSLIDYDFYENQLDFGEEKKINPFSWQKAFTQIFAQGGFDVVIGNPPYSLIGADRKVEQEYYNSGRFELTSYKTNTYILFLEKGLNLIKKENGILGYIIPKSLVFNTYFQNTRKILLEKYAIPQIVEIREKVFTDAEVGDSILFFGSRIKNPSTSILQYLKVENVYPSLIKINEFRTIQEELLNEHDCKFYPPGLKIRIETIPLKEICEINNGLNPGNVRHILISNEKITESHQKMVLGKDIKRYSLEWSGTWVNYDHSLKSTIKVSDIKSKPGMTAQTKVDFALREESIYKGEKILIRKTSDHIIASFDENEFYYDSLSYGIKIKQNSQLSIFFILGLINSKLINDIHETYSDNKDKVFAKVLAANLARLPIPKIDFKDKNHKAKHDEIALIAQNLLKLYNDRSQGSLQTDKQKIENKISFLEDKINNAVYEIYGFEKQEIEQLEKV